MREHAAGARRIFDDLSEIEHVEDVLRSEIAFAAADDVDGQVRASAARTVGDILTAIIEDAAIDLPMVPEDSRDAAFFAAAPRELLQKAAAVAAAAYAIEPLGDVESVRQAVDELAAAMRGLLAVRLWAENAKSRRVEARRQRPLEKNSAAQGDPRRRLEDLLFTVWQEAGFPRWTEKEATRATTEARRAAGPDIIGANFKRAWTKAKSRRQTSSM